MTEVLQKGGGSNPLPDRMDSSDNDDSSTDWLIERLQQQSDRDQVQVCSTF